MSKVEASIFNFDGISLQFPDLVSISSDTFIKDENAKYKILSLVEPDNVVSCFNMDGIINSIYNEEEFIKFVSDSFDLVLTYKKRLLEKIPNSRYMNTTGSFLESDLYNISNKTNSISYLISMKKFTSGHIFRHQVYNSLIGVDRINDFDYCQVITPPSVNKTDYLNKQKFSIIIENEKSDYYFTEKIIDCLLSKTVPIYWGCPSISKFFNSKGIISFDTIEDLHKILFELKINDYDTMLDAVEENYYKAKLIPSYETALKKEISETFYT